MTPKRAMAALVPFVALLSQAAPAIELESCELTSSQGVGLVQARCGTLTRPLNPEAPDGASIELQVAVMASFSPEPQRDAFTVINGGPGGSSVTLYAEGAKAFAGILRERDIIVVDQRGTGSSVPLDCNELASLSGGVDLEAVSSATDECLAELPADPRFFTTSVAVADLDALRAELGYEQLNVYGVSYGTRVALHYARRYPQRVRSLIIDGVVPPGLGLGPNAALNAQETFDRLLERCAADTACAGAFPRLREDFAALRRRLSAAPVHVAFPDPVTGSPREMEISYSHLAVTIRMLSYAPETASLIPLIITEAQARDNFQPIASQAQRILSELSEAMRVGMHNAVVCAEDVPLYGEVDWQSLDATFLGREQVAALQATCSRWPEGIRDPNLHAPLSLAVPTLVLSGEEDPITPPEYGNEVARQLPNSLHLVAGGQGHGVFNRGCIPSLIARFVEAGSFQGLDVSCVQRLAHQPFFLDLMGPAP